MSDTIAPLCFGRCGLQMDDDVGAGWPFSAKPGGGQGSPSYARTARPAGCTWAGSTAARS